jgi:predicted dinucleotide-binding enzyme
VLFLLIRVELVARSGPSAGAGSEATAARLATDLGFEPVDAGVLTQARLLEPYALLWISLAYRQHLGRNFAIRLMRR